MPPDMTRILVVDDELNICHSCQKILAKSNYEVQYALNGYDALKMMEAEPFDIVITDLKMSSLGGMEILQRVKEAYPDTPVIVITGYASVSSAIEVMKMGAMDYLPKPFTPDELRAMVHQAQNERAVRLQNRKLREQQLKKSRSLSLKILCSIIVPWILGARILLATAWVFSCRIPSPGTPAAWITPLIGPMSLCAKAISRDIVLKSETSALINRTLPPAFSIRRIFRIF